MIQGTDCAYIIINKKTSLYLVYSNVCLLSHPSLYRGFEQDRAGQTYSLGNPVWTLIFPGYPCMDPNITWLPLSGP